MKNKIINPQLTIVDSNNEFSSQVSNYVNKNNLLEIQVKAESVKHIVDPNTKRLLSFLFTGTRGGNNRLRIMLLLAEKPLNTHQIAKELELDYKAIKFHLGVLEKNNMVSRAGERYGTIFILSTFLEYNIDAFNEIISKLYKDPESKRFE
jgi:DNA-binding transcriptional ArsR family regulator